MGGGPGIQAEKRTFKYLVDLYLIKEYIHEKYNKYMDCVNKINEKCFSFLFIEENNVLIDTAY